MNISDYDYNLPDELIAQYPAKKRDESRLLVINKSTGKFEHKKFHDIIDYLNPGDVLVLNNTKVIPARLIGHKKTGGKVEIFFLEMLSKNTFKALVKPSARVAERTDIFFDPGFRSGISRLREIPDLNPAKVTVYGSKGKYRVVGFTKNMDIFELLDKYGKTPLPPYIKRESDKEDKNTYQTIYAEQAGAVAAPTAGLHFTKELLEKIKKKGIQVCYVTLHVGYGTFMPVTGEITKHRMHKEIYSIPEQTAKIINIAKKQNRRVIAVGTTTCRSLEAAARNTDNIEPVENKSTRIFIYHPFDFKITDALITNFHLPKSTLLLLVSALCGKDLLFKAYQQAIRKKYRFYSYGDVMFVQD